MKPPMYISVEPENHMHMVFATIATIIITIATIIIIAQTMENNSSGSIRRTLILHSKIEDLPKTVACKRGTSLSSDQGQP